MLVLALDTALAACQVALVSFEGGRELVRAHISRPMASGQAEHLVPMIEEALAIAGATHADISRIALAIGPGTFAGVRIALATARAMRVVLGVPVVGVSTLHALAMEAGTHEGGLLAAIDARRGDVYGQLFDAAGMAQGEPFVAPLASVAALLPAGCIRAFGNGAGLVAGVVPAIIPAGIRDYVDVLAIARLGAAMAAPAAPPSPLYVRAPDAKPQKGALVRCP